MTSLAVVLATAWHHGGPGWWIAGVVLFWILLAGGIVLVFRALGRGSALTHHSGRESALEVLDRRFAEGQLSVEDYQTRRRILDPDADDDAY